MKVRHCWAVLVVAAAILPDVPEDDECAAGSECALNAMQLRGLLKSSDASNSSDDQADPKCASLNDPVNSVCAPAVRWASRGGRYDPHANDWFKDMKPISGVDFKSASVDDWQKLFFCAPPGGKQCGAPPCKCSHPPCGSCFQGNAATGRSCSRPKKSRSGFIAFQSFVHVIQSFDQVVFGGSVEPLTVWFLRCQQS